MTANMSFTHFDRCKSYPVVVFQVNKERHFVNEGYPSFFALSFSKRIWRDQSEARTPSI